MVDGFSWTNATDFKKYELYIKSEDRKLFNRRDWLNTLTAVGARTHDTYRFYSV